MFFKFFFPFSGRILNSAKSRIRGDAKTTWHLRESAVLLSTVAQPLAAPLPRLPVPQLQQTLLKYLKTVKAVASDAEYARTEQLVKDFVAPGSVGEKLHFLLEEKARRSENWLSEWWLNSAYLDFRSPVVIFSSPGLVFPQQNFTCQDDQLRFAAKVVCAALDFKKMIDQKCIPMQTMGGKPLDMSQYFRILSTCRIPGTKRDSLRFFGNDSNPPTHIIVAHNNHFYKLYVYAQDNEVLTEKQIERLLREIVTQSTEPTDPVGILTTENRDTWGKVYKKLIKDNQNKSALDDLQRSIFLLCLDKPNKFLSSKDPRTRAALQMVHGCGSDNNTGNRWFDKTVQFVVGANGEAGLTYEHSPAEGPPIAHLMEHICQYVAGKSTMINGPNDNLFPPKRLRFNIGDEIRSDIKSAANNVDNLIDDLQMTAYEFKEYGKNFVKAQKLSPDSFIQMAIQLAFYRIHKQPGACYESASTRMFLHGRTENIRSTSLESVAFCKAMLESDSNQEKVQLLRKAVEGHKRYVSDAISGLGIDRHLLGLKLMAIENGLDVPQLFLDAGYRGSSHFRLSTSQVAAKVDAFMCYGPLVNDGYGCCYNPLDSQMNFGLSAHRNDSDTCSDRFRDALEQSLKEMQKVLILNQTSKL